MSIVYERALITAPAGEPIQLPAAKEHCNVDFDIPETNGYLEALITTARLKLEAECSRAFVTQGWEIYPPCFPCTDWIQLPLGKLQALTSFTFTDVNGTPTTWTVSGGNLLDEFGNVAAHLDTKSQRGRITLAYGKYWPTAVLKTSNPITIGFDVGYGDVAAVPAPLKHAMLLLVQQWFVNRDVAVVGKSVTMIELPQAVDSLCANYRLY